MLEGSTSMTFLLVTGFLFTQNPKVVQPNPALVF